MKDNCENFLSRLLWRIFVKSSNKPNAIKYEYGRIKFMNEKMDPSFNYMPYLNKENPFFAKWGFKYNMIEAKFYSLSSGVDSNLYVPWSLWQYFIYPYLNRDSWRWPYTDKNMFRRILDFNKVKENVKVRMPETIICRINGVLYDSYENQVDFDKAYEILKGYKGDIIFKPSVETHQGHGVQKIKIDTYGEFLELCNNGGGNFVLQEAIKQHHDMASFNQTSVNTIRICTYRDFDNNYKVLYATQRFGGNNSIFDNASSGGGFVGIYLDGTVNRTIHKFHTLQTWQLPSSAPLVIPSFNEIKDAVLYMHTRLPQFQIIAWDMAVDSEGTPVMIEYNLKQSTELCQMVHGPLFEENDLVQIMERIKNYEINISYAGIVSFKDKKGYTIRR